MSSKLIQIAVVLLLCACSLTSGAAQASRPNVVIFLADDQGWGDLELHGNPYLKTPHLDDFARQATELPRFYVCPVCAPTRASLMTGRYNYRTGVTDVFGVGCEMEPSEVTVAEALRAAGYVTGIFGKWHLGDEGPRTPNAQGFDEALVFRGAAMPPKNYFDPKLLHNNKPQQYQGYCMDVFTDAAIDFMTLHRNEPFFVYLPANLIHSPLVAKKECLARYASASLEKKTAKICGMMASVDDNFGRLRKALADLGLEDNTLLIYTSDNGPCCSSIRLDRFMAGLQGLKGTVYENGIRVPCFMRWPAGFKSTGKIEHVACHMDIMPTILDVCGVSAPDGVKFDGKSLLPLLRNPTISWPDRTIFFQWNGVKPPLHRRAFAALTERWKLVQPVGIDNPRHRLIFKHYGLLCKAQGRGDRSLEGPLRYELYDIVNDPGETKNLAAEHPDIIDRLTQQYDAWFKEVCVGLDGKKTPRMFSSQNPGSHSIASIAKVQTWAASVFAEPRVVTSAENEAIQEVHTGRRLRVPFSFTYDGKRSDEFLDHWDYTTQTRWEQNVIARTNTYADPESGLTITCEIKRYPDFAGIDWVFRLTNNGDADTPIIEDFLPLDVDTLFTGSVAGGSAKLRWCNGDRYRDDFQPDASSFLPHDEVLESEKPRQFASTVTFKYLPYFNLQVPHEGWIIAVGWTGRWKAEFLQDAEGKIGVRAGMQKTHFRLKPGESVRTPSMVLLHWTGDDMIVGHNQFRRLVFADYCQKIGDKPAMPPIAHNTCATPYVHAKERNEPMEMLDEAGELATIDYIADLGCEAYWMDAYWYPQPWNLNIGNWYCRAEDFPRGLKPLADAAHSKGMKFVLWMIPPSVAANTKWSLEHPEFLHGEKKGQGGLWKMGDPKAREWLTNWVVDLLNDWQVDIYREDGSGLPPEEGDDRIGVAEMKHVEGLYKFWDDLTSKSHAKLMDNCMGGGNRIDIETSRRSFYLWRSDFNDIGEGLKGEKHWPRMALADQVISGGLNLYSPFHSGPVWSVKPYSFRSCMSMGIALYGDIQRDSFPREQARKAIAELKMLRPLFLGDIYPLLKLTSSQSDWYAYQLDQPDLGQGCAFFFRRPDSETLTKKIMLSAIDADADYEVSITGETYRYEPWKRMKGRDFMSPRIQIADKAASVLLRYKRIAQF